MFTVVFWYKENEDCCMVFLWELHLYITNSTCGVDWCFVYHIVKACSAVECTTIDAQATSRGTLVCCGRAYSVYMYMSPWTGEAFVCLESLILAGYLILFVFLSALREAI